MIDSPLRRAAISLENGTEVVPDGRASAQAKVFGKIQRIATGNIQTTLQPTAVISETTDENPTLERMATRMAAPARGAAHRSLFTRRRGEKCYGKNNEKVNVGPCRRCGEEIRKSS